MFKYTVPGTGVVEGVDEDEGECTGHTAGRDVSAELHVAGGVLTTRRKVQRLIL